jgi:hypothetical protein
MLDARVPLAELRYVARFWEELFQGQGIVVKICAGKPGGFCDEEDSEARYALVGGSILLFRPTSSIKISKVSYDPGDFGFITKVILNICLRHSLQWLGVYVPSGTGQGVHSLTTKLEGWYNEHRRPHVSEATLRLEANPFSGPAWVWSLVTHYVCSFSNGGKNNSRLGSIVRGDVNQSWEPGDHDVDSLFSRTSEIGLHFHSGLWVEEHGVEPFNTYHCMGDKGSVIDFMFADLPRSRWRGGGSPSDVAFNLVSDHLPVYGCWELPAISADFREFLRPSPAIVVLDLSRPKEREKIIQAFATSYPVLRKHLSLKLRAKATEPAGTLSESLERLSYEVTEMARAIADQNPPAYTAKSITRSSNSISLNMGQQAHAAMECSPHAREYTQEASYHLQVLGKEGPAAGKTAGTADYI